MRNKWDWRYVMVASSVNYYRFIYIKCLKQSQKPLESIVENGSSVHNIHSDHMTINIHI